MISFIELGILNLVNEDIVLLIKKLVDRCVAGRKRKVYYEMLRGKKYEGLL